MRVLSLVVLSMIVGGISASGDEFPAFKHHEINPDAGTGLAITVSDINQDGMLDIVGVSSRDVAWYENPTWERHLIADTLKGSNVCIAGRDLDGDGVEEFALGADWQYNNTDSGGALFLLHHGNDVTEPWRAVPLLEEEPTLHRIRWADMEGDGAPELVVAPLKGRGTTEPAFQERGVDLFILRPPENFTQTPWNRTTIDRSLHVLHNIWPMPQNGKDAVLAASFEGVTKLVRTNDGSWSTTCLTRGNPESLPDSGAGEVKSSADDLLKLATIEPWHSNQVVVYTRGESETEWNRHVIDDTFRGGHAVWWADFDRDGEDELLAGFRDKAPPKDLPGLNIYDLNVDKSNGDVEATKHILDNGGMATEDALAADINSDGWPDVVAYGRATRNIKYYENLGRNDGD